MPLDSSKVANWYAAKASIDLAKEIELKLRLEICSEVIGANIKGTHHLIVGDVDLVATAKLNTSIDKELLDSLWKDLLPTEIDCIKFEPNLVAKNYNALSASSKLHQAITTKPGTPSLAIKPAK